MCILIVTTAHPDYPLILLSNRDEFLSRPTAVADWWDDEGKPVLSGRDLRHPSRGTWLGVTRQGRLACLTNFREDSEDAKTTEQSNSHFDDDGKTTHPIAVRSETTAGPSRSRGEITKAYLASELTPRAWAEHFLQEQSNGDWGDMGGFSLFFGRVLTDASSDGIPTPTVQLGILSNRTRRASDVIWLTEEASAGKSTGSANGMTHAFTCSLSNSHFGDRAWPKVVRGEQLLADFIREASEGASERGEILDGAFNILSTNTMPKRGPDDDWSAYARQLRNSILIPPVQAGDDQYGTQKQTVIVLDKSGELYFVERTLFDYRGKAVPSEEGKRQYQFKLDTPCMNGSVT